MNISDGETRSAKVAKSILLWTTRRPANRATRSVEFVRLFRLNRWLTYLILVPVIVAAGLLGIFFFAVFVGFFAAAAALIALRAWWFSWKPRRPGIVENSGSGRVISIREE